jgi:hypothetical protein
LGHTAGAPVVENKTDATCGKAGSYDSVVYCSECHEEISRTTEEIPATGSHKYEGVVTLEPTYTTAGVMTYTCGTCGDHYDEEIPVKVATDLNVTISTSMQAGLALESEFLLYIDVTLQNLNGVDPATLTGKVGVMLWNMSEFTYDNDTAIMENCTWVADDTNTIPNSSALRVYSNGIAAKRLGDKIAFRPYYQREDGTYVYGRLVTNYSPSKYCYNQLNKTSDPNFKNLLVSILNYGAAAQVVFDHNTDALMNADLTDAQKTITWNDSLVRTDWSMPAAKEGELARNRTVFTNRNITVALEGAIDYKWTYTVASDVQIKSMKVLTWSEATYNSVDVLTVDNADDVHDVEAIGNNQYVFVSDGNPAKTMFNCQYACAVIETEDGQIYYSGVVGNCPERFTYMKLTGATEANLLYLSKCMVIYGDAARTYFPG